MDDLCLGYLLRGCIENCLGDVGDAETSLKEVLNNEQGIALDHWMAPFARVELASIMLARMRSAVLWLLRSM